MARWESDMAGWSGTRDSRHSVTLVMMNMFLTKWLICGHLDWGFIIPYMFDHLQDSCGKPCHKPTMTGDG